MTSISTLSLTRDNLIAGDLDIVTESVTIASGADLSAGAVLGTVTANGKFALSASAAGDGSETPTAILLTDAAAASADKVAIVARTGVFNENALSFGTGHTVSSVRAALRDAGIHLKAATAAGAL